MSVSDIKEKMREIYIANKVNQAALEWQNRPLEPYLSDYMDGRYRFQSS